ncbi:MAG: cupredoxin domain-containing protein [Candidatus Pacearchaeota archaeon]
MTKYLFWIFVVVLILAAGIYIINSNKSDNQTITGATTKNNTKSPDQNLKVFVITGENFRFIMDGVENPELKVKMGDKVRIEFINKEGFHDWVIDDFNAATKKIRAGEKATVEFIANKKGTFEYYCSVGEHRAMGMKGFLIVE